MKRLCLRLRANCVEPNERVKLYLSDVLAKAWKGAEDHPFDLARVRNAYRDFLLLAQTPLKHHRRFNSTGDRCRRIVVHSSTPLLPQLRQ